MNRFFFTVLLLFASVTLSAQRRIKNDILITKNIKTINLLKYFAKYHHKELRIIDTSYILQWHIKGYWALNDLSLCTEDIEWLSGLHILCVGDKIQVGVLPNDKSLTEN